MTERRIRIAVLTRVDGKLCDRARLLLQQLAGEYPGVGQRR